MSCFRRSVWGFLLVALAAPFALAQHAVAQESSVKPAAGEAQGAPPSLRILRVSRAPKIDDFLAGGTPVGLEVTGFRQRQPGDGAPASQPTTAFLSYDDKNLYVVFVCKEDPAKLRAHLAKREDFGEDDNVAVYLDTFHDHRRAYLFDTNAHGVQLDGIHTEGQGLDTSFDTLWYSDARITNDGFVVWMAIPFKSLRFSNEEIQTWAIALDRVIIWRNEVVFWPYVTARKEGFANQFATLEGLERISPGRNLQFIPYGIYSHSRFLNQSLPGGPDFRTKDEGRGGLDAKIVLKDAITLDIALNPDFSQVESDEPQVTVNQRFEVFFPEKRPFFIENAGFFRTPVNLFFSRRIADPQFGMRVTGKAGPWTIAALGMDDRQPTSAFVPSGAGPGIVSECDPLDDRRSGIGVFRVQREFASQSSIGMFASTRDYPSCSNRVISFDTRIKLNANWVFAGQIYRSFTRRADGSHRTGPGAFLEMAHRGRHFTSTSRFQDRSPDFRTHLGFVSRVDVRLVEQFFGYFWRPEKKPVLSFGPSVYTVVNWDRQNRVQDWLVLYEWAAEFKGQTFLRAGGQEQFELFQNFRFREHRHHVAFNTQFLRWLSLNSLIGWRSAPNFFPAASLQPFLGNGTDITFGFTLRPTPRFRFDQSYLYTRLATRTGSTPAGFSPGTSIFNNHILRTKVNYQFTKELSLRAILDYNSVLPNSQLVALSRTKSLKADLLLTYLLNPGTALYVGYSDLYENLEVDPFTAAPLRTLRLTGSPGHSTGRQIFIKLSYLFRF